MKIQLTIAIVISKLINAFPPAKTLRGRLAPIRYTAFDETQISITT